MTKKANIEAIRRLAVEIAEQNAGPGTVLICNLATEPTPLPKSELLDDHCAWCQKAIYYDRKMPSPADITRVCIPCGLLLLEAQKKGAN
jgi:hypothetical protein